MTSLFSAGVVLDGVELVKFKEKGGQAEIWEVRNMQYPEHQDLALKFWYTPWEERDERDFMTKKERLQQETKLLGGLRSQYIVIPHFTIGGQHEVDGTEYAIFGVVMDLASEGSLENFLQGDTFTSFEPLEKVRLLEHLAHGLDVLQDKRIVHSDIKPANLLISLEGKQYIPHYADFGYAFRLGETIVRGGTPAYMAPELILNEGEPSFRTDIFSLGIVFYEILLGAHPLREILRRGDPMKALQGYYPTVDYVEFSKAQQLANRDLVEVIQRMCSRDPEMRPTISEVIETLSEISLAGRSQSIVHLEQLYPAAANRWRWSENVHRAFGENELFVFISGSSPTVDPPYIAEALIREKLFGFSIFRLLGASDYLLRIWRKDGDKPHLEGVLKRYKAERSGDYIIFEPRLRWPPARNRDHVLKPLDVLGFLKDMVDADPEGAKGRARNPAFIVGEAKWWRERAKRNKGIRAICRVWGRAALNPALASVIGDRIYAQTRKVAGVSEVEVLANPGRPGVNAEFVLVVELTDFHRYREILKIVGDAISELGSQPPDQFRTHFEMDPEAPYESYDGRLFYELYRVRRH